MIPPSPHADSTSGAPADLSGLDRRAVARFGSRAEGLAVMVVEVAGNAFAIPAWAVDRVTVLVPVTPLPLVPPYVDGLVGLGGAIVPQIDLRRRLALAAASAGDGGELLVVAAAGGSYALRVDRVLTLTVAAPGAIRVFSGATGDGSLQPGVIVGERAAEAAPSCASWRCRAASRLRLRSCFGRVPS